MSSYHINLNIHTDKENNYHQSAFSDLSSVPSLQRLKAFFYSIFKSEIVKKYTQEFKRVQEAGSASGGLGHDNFTTNVLDVQRKTHKYDFFLILIDYLKDPT